MIKDIYATSACGSYKTQQLASQIREANLSDAGLLPVEDKARRNIPGLLMLSPRNKTVGVFAHPFTMELYGEQHVVIDARAYSRVDPKTGQVVVTQTTEFDFLRLRGCLQVIWNSEHCNDLSTVGTLAVKVFCRWISENLARRLNLSALEQVQVSMLAGLYYYSQFRSGITPEDLARIAGQVGRAVNTSADKVLALYETVPEVAWNMGTIDRFIATVQVALHSPRLESLSPALMYGAVCGGWFGANAREILAVAIEHPPTWLAVVYEAIDNRGYQKSFLGKLVDSSNRPPSQGQSLVLGVNNLLARMSHD